MSALRDVALVAWFEWIRAIRTWRAVALVALYVVASAGGSYIFVEVIRELEVALADDVDAVLRAPVLAIFHLWLGVILVPFVGATAAAESISTDLGTRAIRYEAVRTGRLELVTGRFVGQALLTGVASLLGTAGAWTVGVLYLYGTDPLDLAVGLLTFAVRAWAYSLAYVGMGVGLSQWTANPNVARVLAILGVAVTWPMYGQFRFNDDVAPGWLADLVMPLLPQGWMSGLWTPSWPITALVCASLGYAWVGIGYLRFARRDL